MHPIFATTILANFNQFAALVELINTRVQMQRSGQMSVTDDSTHITNTFKLVNGNVLTLQYDKATQVTSLLFNNSFPAFLTTVLSLHILDLIKINATDNALLFINDNRGLILYDQHAEVIFPNLDFVLDLDTVKSTDSLIGLRGVKVMTVVSPDVTMASNVGIYVTPNRTGIFVLKKKNK